MPEKFIRMNILSNNMKINEILASGESDKVEFKESLAEIKEILKTIVAFANTKGGVILIGVKDDGTVKGIKVGRRSINKLLNEIKNKIKPLILPKIEIIKIEGKDVILIEVSEGINKPFSLKGRIYKRINSRNEQLSIEEIEKMILEKYKELSRFELSKVNYQIDKRAIKEFVIRAKEYRGIDLVGLGENEIIEKLKAKNNVAGALCFSSNLQSLLPYAGIKIGKFVNNKLINDWYLCDNLFMLIPKVLELIKSQLGIEYRIDERGRRIEEWEIPKEAIREVIVNALVHRDYTVPSFIYISIHEDKIVIENPGKLLEPLKIEDLKKMHKSILRNPTIAQIMFLSGYIEQWGSGTLKVIKKCIQRGLKEPKFEQSEGFFKVTLYRRSINETLKEVLSLLKKEKESKEIAKEMNVSERTVRNYIKKLIDLGLVKKVKKGKKVLYTAI